MSERTRQRRLSTSEDGALTRMSKDSRASHREKQNLKKPQDISKSRRCVKCSYCKPWKAGGNSANHQPVAVTWARLSLDDRRFLNGTPHVVPTKHGEWMPSPFEAYIDESIEWQERNGAALEEDEPLADTPCLRSRPSVALEDLLKAAHPSKRPHSQAGRYAFEVVPSLRRTLSIESDSISTFSLDSCEYCDSDNWEILSEPEFESQSVSQPHNRTYASVVARDLLK